MSGLECCSNAPILNPNSGVGHIEKLGGLDTYVTGPSDSNLAILMVSEIFGSLQDKVAASGYYVVVPDFLYGDSFTSENSNRTLPVWFEDHQPNEAFEDAKPVIEALKHKGVSIPIAILGAEIDKYCPPELLKQSEQLLTAELGVTSL